MKRNMMYVLVIIAILLSGCIKKQEFLFSGKTEILNEFFPEYFNKARKGGIFLEHLMILSPGFKWDDIKIIGI